ncbi:MAG: cyclic nucleotide-binding domain-containing protein [Oscillospiraceae bacterium]|nr:cyclic nucleotide-binding domain-containing protein [Oscillospiraceae bacterium]
MELDLKELMKLPLFQGIFEPHMEELTGCIYTRVEQFPAGAEILPPEKYGEAVAVVMKGAVRVTRTDTGAAMAELSENQMFGRGFFQGDILPNTDEEADPAPVDWKIAVTAAEDCRILFVSHENLITPCWFSCFYHARAISNAQSEAKKINEKYGKLI